MSAAREAVGRHVARFFRGHPVFAVDVPADAHDRVPGLEILEVGPGPRSQLVSYVTLGCWEAVQRQREGLEFVLSTREADVRHTEVLGAVASFHAATPEQRLDRGGVVPLGRPWTPGSACDRMLVTLPYPYGPELEECHWRRNFARLLWVVPITADEELFATVHGLEALEQRFEEAEVRFADPERPSVV